ncbi:scavenger receptor cysteine-rich domain-containing protein DMBT1-like [Amphiura filiformis]|uniref:scavenger receptor cysteine-rich domain-containing protein DMBT1-like n=1 Tax=Amphiura filiformis TaxID=82378 RepID=UPI003B217E4D
MGNFSVLATVVLISLFFRQTISLPWGTDLEDERTKRDGNPTTEQDVIRLVGGSSLNEGRVEVLVNGVWGSVCDDFWDINDASVACRQLGFPSAISAHGSAVFGRSSGPILLDDLECLGDEASLQECSSADSHNCGHSEDAGVICQSPIRLVGGTVGHVGRIEVFLNHEWGSVCDDAWDMNDANVVCRQLGYEGAIEVLAKSQFGQGVGPIHLDDVACDGSEVSLLQCSHGGIGVHNCRHDEDIAVRCQPNVRLVGDSTVASQGRVEVFYNGVWGTVCDDLWGNFDATVVCRELGFGTDATAVQSTARGFGRGVGPIFLDDVRCTGSEASLLQCSHRGIGTHNCRHSEDAGVICHVTSVPNLRVVDGITSNEGRLEIRINSQWGSLCDDAWDINDAHVACRQMGFPGAIAAPGSAQFGPGSGPIFLDDVSCIGVETKLLDCPHTTGRSHNCAHSEDAGVICQRAVRVIGGSLPSEGRVEVYHDNHWGSICDDHWDILDANVVCKQLGYPAAIAALHSARFGEGSGPIHLDDLDCEGNEESLFECGHVGIGNSNCVHAEDAGAVCGVGVRLINGSGSFKGRVEVFANNQWGTICDDNWDITDASIVCKQLGFPAAIASPVRALFGEGRGPIVMGDLQCDGSETSLFQCPHNGVNNCQHSEDAGAICDIKVRLSGGSQPNEGRVEVYFNGEWSSVCDDGWDITDANVVCRQLGYTEGAVEATTGARFGLGQGPIVLDDVDCQGDESDLLDCPSPGLGMHNCGHHEDAGAICQSNESIRLVGGSAASEGRVEILHNNVWGSVCDDAWDLQDAQVVCRELGYITAMEATHQARFGAGQGPIHLDDVVCRGTESTLIECVHDEIGTHNCGHHEDAGVICREGVEVQLVNGHTRNEGRVEIFVDNQWQTICDDSWDLNDANVICRQLGFSEAIAAVSSALFGPGQGAIAFDDVQCNGHEVSLAACAHSEIGVHDCNHLEDAGVICRPKVRVVGGFSPNEGRVEVFMEGTWGTVCNHNWDLNDATVVCRELGFGSALGAGLTGNFGEGVGAIHMSDVSCSGTEAALSDCSHSEYGEHSCGHQYDASVICSVPIRLVGGSRSNEGRIELYFDGMWGTICDTMWDIDDAHVVCRELGFTQAIEATKLARFGQGAGMIFLDEVRCNGTEDKIIECPYASSLGITTCTHANDAGVICQVPETVRLEGGRSPNQGRVEVYHNGLWGSVCDDAWDINDGHVICRQLGYLEAQDVTTQSAYGGGSGPIHLDDVRCTGQESTIYECQHGQMGRHNCDHTEDAGVVCIAPASVRLSGGQTSNEGRVEIFYNDAWGTLCDNGWDIDDAAVVCSELSYPGVVDALEEATFGEGMGPIHFDQMQCVGDERSLLKCMRGGDGGTCGHGQDASVVCLPQVRLVDGGTNREGRVEIFVDDTWGTVCDDLWDISDAEVVCHQLGFNSAKQATTQAYFGSGAGHIHLDDVTCTGSETSLLECAHSGLGNHNCGHPEDAGVVCSDAADVRLVSGESHREGMVEINFGGNQWGPVCSTDWDLADGNVLCRQLGYPSARYVYTYNNSESGSVDNNTTETVITSIGNVQCSGVEDALSDCLYKVGSEMGICYGYACVKCTPKVRLIGTSNQGRLQVYINQEWGSVCDDLWDNTDAEVACQELGFTSGVSAQLAYAPDQEMEPILMDNVECHGDENSLFDCPHSSAHNCQHYEDVPEDVAIRCA